MRKRNRDKTYIRVYSIYLLIPAVIPHHIEGAITIVFHAASLFIMNKIQYVRKMVSTLGKIQIRFKDFPRILLVCPENIAFSTAREIELWLHKFQTGISLSGAGVQTRFTINGFEKHET